MCCGRHAGGLRPGDRAGRTLSTRPGQRRFRLGDDDRGRRGAANCLLHASGRDLGVHCVGVRQDPYASRCVGLRLDVRDFHFLQRLLQPSVQRTDRKAVNGQTQSLARDAGVCAGLGQRSGMHADSLERLGSVYRRLAAGIRSDHLRRRRHDGLHQIDSVQLLRLAGRHYGRSDCLSCHTEFRPDAACRTKGERGGQGPARGRSAAGR